MRETGELGQYELRKERMWGGGKGKRKAMREMGELGQYELRMEAGVGRREREEEGNGGDRRTGAVYAEEGGRCREEGKGRGRQ